MNRFKLLNNITGWIVFAIAAFTYLSTIEPTASFWDCGEFISSAFKLDVGHPPGAPFFMLAGKFASLFASDVTEVAKMVNSLSALVSAATILFLFWAITHLGRKVIMKEEKDFNFANLVAVLGAGTVGALAYTWSDTFWFSAVEGEVYASSSLFTALVFWLILKWEDLSDQSGSDKWLILIAYLMGLSIGVHLLNLLAIPAIVLVYYFKNYQPSTKGVVTAMLISVGILATVLYGLVPGFVQVASLFELLFVNTMGMPYNTGVFVYVAILIALLVWTIYETNTEKSYNRMVVAFISTIVLTGIPFFGSSYLLGIVLIAVMIIAFRKFKSKIEARWLNTSIVMITVALIGYSSYAVIMVRSAANPPMDQNSPDNVFALKGYLNREQYGDRPLFYGQTYNAPVKLDIKGNMCVPVMDKGEKLYAPAPTDSEAVKDHYIVTGRKIDYKYDDRFMMLFPRMYSSQPSHVNAYKSWAGVKGNRVSFEYCGQERTEYVPTFIENMRFFVSYQVNFMYWRYFMWNFSGRQNDMQGFGEIDHGNWITGIPFVDEALVGDQANMPSEIKNNKGHNKYYMLPFLLGIIGILFQLYSGKEGKHQFWITFLMFFLTGLAIVIYLNQTPYQPRERDYAYAGSFYAFSIWIGLGVLGIFKALKKYVPENVLAVLAVLVSLGVPALMAQQNWDDHDRSNRYVARDFGANYLMSCKKNAIIFTNGDNDTFPLWYNQEVEGVRTDIRVCNLSYLQTDWYIDQMKRGAYESEPCPIHWKAKDYQTGQNEVISLTDRLKSPLDLETAFNLALDPELKMDDEGFIPTTQLYIPVDMKNVEKGANIDSSLYGMVSDRVSFDLGKKRRLTKSEMMVMEMLSQNKWQRPMYFAVTVGDDYYLGLNDYFQLAGMAYQITPASTNGRGSGVDVDRMYDNMMNKFRYGNVSDPKVYLDENTLRMCRTHRMMFTQLVGALVAMNDSVRAEKALDKCMEVLPGTTVRYDYTTALLGEDYLAIGKQQKGNAILDAVAKDCVENLNWYFALKMSDRKSIEDRIGHNMGVLNHILMVARQYKSEKILDQYYPEYSKYAQILQIK